LLEVRRLEASQAHAGPARTVVIRTEHATPLGWTDIDAIRAQLAVELRLDDRDVEITSGLRHPIALRCRDRNDAVANLFARARSDDPGLLDRLKRWSVDRDALLSDNADVERAAKAAAAPRT
jgi:hypothetical protein